MTPRAGERTVRKRMPRKILVADDSLTIQKVVELTFSDADYQLTCVSNGRLALDRVRDDPPDLILADVVMPEKNGYEVCEAIKRDPSTAGIPVVLLAGTFEPFDDDCNPATEHRMQLRQSLRIASLSRLFLHRARPC